MNRENALVAHIVETPFDELTAPLRLGHPGSGPGLFPYKGGG
jgi:hypothetical protein